MLSLGLSHCQSKKASLLDDVKQPFKLSIGVTLDCLAYASSCHKLYPTQACLKQILSRNSDSTAVMTLLYPAQPLQQNEQLGSCEYLFILASLLLIASSPYCCPTLVRPQTLSSAFNTPA